MKFLSLNMISIMILLVNLIMTLSYFLIYSSKNRKGLFFKLPLLIRKLYVAFFVFPLFIAPFFSYSKFIEYNLPIVITGIVISALGALIIILSFLKIGAVPSIKNDGKLSTQGTYKIVRHPIYFGTILIQLGLTMLNQALISLIYLPISITLYYLMASMEEKDLINTFGEQYHTFREKTKGKIIPYIL